MGFTAALKEGIKASLCGLGTVSGAFNGLLSRAARNPRLGSAGSTVADLIDFYDRFGAGIARNLCNREPPPPLQPDFTGGQCSGVTYRVNFTGVTDGGSTSGFLFLTGPIGPIQKIQTGSGGSAATSFVVTSGSGLQTLFSASTSSNPRIQGVTVIRLDGQPDNCGNPPIIPPVNTDPSIRTFNNQPIIYTDDEGNSQTVNVNLFFGFAYFDLNADLNIPVSITIGPNNFNADFNLNTGDINLNFGRGKDGGKLPGSYDCCGGYGDIDPGDDIPPDGVEPSPDGGRAGDEVRAIAGLLTIATSVGSRSKVSEVGDGRSPTLYLPRLGVVRFLGVAGAAGQTGWSMPYDLKSARQITYCDFPVGAIDYDVFEVTGVEIAAYPIYKPYRTYDESD